MIRFALIAAMIIVPVSVQAQETNKVQTIVADNRAECGIHRLAMHRRQDNERFAYKLARSYEAKGIKTRVIVLNPGQPVGVLDNVTNRAIPVRILNVC